MNKPRTTALDLDFLRSQVISVDTQISKPFGERLMLYAGFTASGRSLRFVEDFLLHLQRLQSPFVGDW